MLVGIPSLLGRIQGDTMYWDTFYQVSGSDFTTSSASLVDITGLSHIAVPNSLYEVEVVLKVQGTDTAGMKYGWNYSAAGTTGRFAIMASTASAADTNIGIDTVPIATNSGNHVTVANADMIVFMKGIVSIGANAGNITIKILKTTSGTATVYIGSVMKIKKLA